MPLTVEEMSKMLPAGVGVSHRKSVQEYVLYRKLDGRPISAPRSERHVEMWGKRAPIVWASIAERCMMPGYDDARMLSSNA